MSEFIVRKWKGLNDFFNKYKRVLDMHAPCRSSRGATIFINKAVSKDITAWTQIRNNFLKYRSKENKNKFSKQPNFCVLLLRKHNADYIGNFNRKMLEKPDLSI